VPSDSLNKALIGPLAQNSPAGFLFLSEQFFSGPRRRYVKIAFGKADHLVPAIVQDDHTGDVLMLGFMNEEALAETQRTGEVVFYSRSRNRLWKKGESSGHFLKVRDVRVDCDADALLVRVQPIGPGVCHEGYRSCFFRRMENDGSVALIEERTFEPGQVYGQEKK
jgi:phosphoribosyl-AMP cyclohydrolase